MAEEKKVKRVHWGNPGDQSGNLQKGTSPNIPMPNVVRIEQLSATSMERFLKGRYASALTGKDTLYTASGNLFSGDELYDSFYGLLTSGKGEKLSISINNTWEAQQGDGAFNRFMKFITKGGSKKKGGGDGVLDSAIGLFSNTVKATKSFVDSSNTMLGINNIATGSGSVKSFKSIDINGITVKCAWYMPEQEALAIDGLKRLYRMAYPKPVNIKALPDALANVAIQQMANMKEVTPEVSQAAQAAMPNGLKDVADYWTRAFFDLLPDPPEKGASPDTTGFFSNLVKTVYDMYELSGLISTINPLPVRLSIGHYLDMEPMVIEAIKTKFSKEVFINEQGKHLPIYAEVTISLKMFLNPTPDQQFIKILDTEAFGYAQLFTGL